MTSRERIPGRVYSLVPVIDGDHITPQANYWSNKPGISIGGKAKLVRAGKEIYLAIDPAWKDRQTD